MNKVITTERGFWINGSHTFLDENNIIHVVSVGFVSGNDALLHKMNILRLYDMVEEKVNVMIDANRAGRPSAEARAVWNELNTHPKTGRIAIYGLSPVAYVVASLVIKLSRFKSMRFFETREEAFEWVNIG